MQKLSKLKNLPKNAMAKTDDFINNHACMVGSTISVAGVMCTIGGMAGYWYCMNAPLTATSIDWILRGVGAGMALAIGGVAAFGFGGSMVVDKIMER